VVTFRSSEIFPGLLNHANKNVICDFHYSEQTDLFYLIKRLRHLIECR